MLFITKIITTWKYIQDVTKTLYLYNRLLFETLTETALDDFVKTIINARVSRL